MANNSGTHTTSEDQIKNIESSITQLVNDQKGLEELVTNGTISQEEGDTRKVEIRKKINILQNEKAEAASDLALNPNTTTEKAKEVNDQENTNDHKKEEHKSTHSTEHSLHLAHNKSTSKNESEPSLVDSASSDVPPDPSENKERGMGKSSSISFEKDSSFSVNENRNYEDQIDKTAQAIANTTKQETPPSTPTPSEAKPEKYQPNSPQKIVPSQETSTNGATTATVSQITSPIEHSDQNIPSQKSIKESSPHKPTTPQKAPSKTKQVVKTAAKKGAKGYVDIYKYTPLGFLLGRLSPRLKEWEFGKKIATRISEKKLKKKEETESNDERNTQLEPKKIQKKSKTLAATKKATSATLTWYKNVYKNSPLGILYNNTKHLIPPSITAGIKKILPRKKIPPSKPLAEIGKPKTAKDYQRIGINRILTKAIANGFDRFELLRKVRDAKVWQSKAWKYGRYAVSPLGATGYALYKRRREQRQKQEEKTNPSSHQAHAQPRVLRSGIQNRSSFPAMSNLNKHLGRSLRNKSAQKALSAAGKKGGQQIAKKALSQIALTFLKTPAGWVTVGVSCVILLFIVFVMTIITIASDSSSGSALGGGAGDVGGGGQPPTQNPIPNFTLQKTVSQTELAEIDEITYTISYSFTSGSTVKKEDIIIFDQIPENTKLVDNKTSGNYTLDTTDRTLSWNLSDSGNAAASTFSFTVLPVKTNINVVNSAWAQANASTAGPGGAQSPNACTRPKEGTGYCSYEHLLPYFNNQPDLALTASLICNLESGSDPFATNKVCPDYSIGLFQVNLIAHCGGAFDPPPTCTVLNSSLRNACEQRFLDPLENIRYAYQLYLSGGTGWTANKWSTYPAAKSILDSCGNI